MAQFKITVYDANGVQKSTASSLPTTLLTGTLQAAQEPAHTGDVTNSAGSLAMTLATVNSNVGTYIAPRLTVNAKGLITAADDTTQIPVARLGTGTPSAETILFGDGAWKPNGKILWQTKTALGSNANNITISSFPTYGTYYNLHIRYTLRSDKAAALENCRLQFNNDTTATNYLSSFLYAQASGSAVGSGSITAVGLLIPVSVVGNTGLANTFSQLDITIPFWGDTSRNRDIQAEGGLASGTTLADLWTFKMHGTWKNAANAITSIKLVPDTGTNFVTGSTVEMWAE